MFLNFPTALRNCLDMVAVGGHFLGVTPANNLMGHGFYQLSPELYARVFQEENGFCLEKMVIYELGKSAWYEVIDPAQAGRRVILQNRRPTYLGVWARKIRQAEVFCRVPQQSDYASSLWSHWKQQDAHRACRMSSRHRSGLRSWLRGLKKWLKPRFAPEFYKPVEF